jgi:hypothetical protein
MWIPQTRDPSSSVKLNSQEPFTNALLMRSSVRFQPQGNIMYNFSTNTNMLFLPELNFKHEGKAQVFIFLNFNLKQTSEL